MDPDSDPDQMPDPALEQHTTGNRQQLLNVEVNGFIIGGTVRKLLFGRFSKNIRIFFQKNMVKPYLFPAVSQGEELFSLD
jgi:hypothetical protein